MASASSLQVPGDWAIRHRRGRRLVVKEVNPYLLAHLLSYEPIIVYLVRHPVAVAASMNRLGWLESTSLDPDQLGASLLNTIPRDILNYINHANDPWLACGCRQALVLRHTRLTLASYKQHLMIRYEDLCTRPLDLFGQVFRFCDLPFDDQVGQLIRKTTAGDDRGGDYSRFRESGQMNTAWKGQVKPAHVESVKEGYQFVEEEFYASDEDWRL